jgi:hypothetical protein
MGWGLRIGLSDEGLRRCLNKLIYTNHRLPPWLNEDATLRSLEQIDIRSAARRLLKSYVALEIMHPC